MGPCSEWCYWVESTHGQRMKEDQGLVLSHAEHSFSHEGVDELCFFCFFEVQEYAVYKGL